MANASIGGLVSGLDTASIISQMMQLEARPQTMLRTRMGVEQKAITSLQSVNAKLAAIATKAAELAKATSWTPTTATSDNSKVTASVTSGAAQTSLSFTVTETAVAAANSYVTTAAKDTAGTMAANTQYAITYADGRATELINAGDGSLQDIADALNQKAGVRATLVLADTSAVPPTYRLHVESRATGGSTGFSITEVDPNNPPNPPASPVPFLGGVAVSTAGLDAAINLSNGTTISSKSNTITGLMPGVDVTLLAGSKGTSATITVFQDSQGMTDKVKALVDAVNGVLDEVSSLTAYNSATKSSGPLAGDATLRDVRNQLVSTVAGGVGGMSLAPYGIQTDRNGKLVFDADKFKAAYQADPTATASQFTAAGDGLAVALETVTKRFSDGLDGTLTGAIKGRTTIVDRMQDDIDGWDVRLVQRKSSLERQYGALEVALGKLQNQSTWLAGQISSLPQMGG
jgi:flagellar hook-associated protein 2